MLGGAGQAGNGRYPYQANSARIWFCPKLSPATIESVSESDQRAAVDVLQLGPWLARELRTALEPRFRLLPAFKQPRPPRARGTDPISPRS